MLAFWVFVVVEYAFFLHLAVLSGASRRQWCRAVGVPGDHWRAEDAFWGIDWVGVLDGDVP